MAESRIIAIPTDASAAIGVALDFGQRSLNVGNLGGVILVLLLEGKDIAVLHAGCLLKSFDGGATGRGWRASFE